MRVGCTTRTAAGDDESAQRDARTDPFAASVATLVVMLRILLAATALTTVVLTTSPAQCDPVGASTPPATQSIRTIVIYGRPEKPMIAIVVRTPTAAEAAGAAHDVLHARLLARVEAATMSLEHVGGD
jgi:hypothetical protein